MSEDEKQITRRRFLASTTVATVGLAAGCGGGGTDADAGRADAGGETDGGASDGGVADAGAQDAGAEDAGAPEPVVPPEDTDEASTFGLGVSSGDVLPTAAILWTRYDGSMPLRAVAWEVDASGTYLRQLPSMDVTPADGGYVHVEVTGLNPAARHRYAFFEMDGETRVGRSPIGRFRAALAETSMEPLIIAGVSCTSNGRAKSTLERAGAREDLDLLLMTGDATYNDGAASVGEYRDKWDESMASAGWRAVRQGTSVLATWDDHEVDNNFNPESDDTTNARQTFFEHLPLRRDGSEPDRIWKRMRWGLTAEIFVLDCRGERQPSTRGDADVYISRAQMDWLKNGLRDSPCVFKLIVNSVPIGDMPFPAENDRWEGYPTQREEILRFIDDEPITGVLWVAGDFHFASIGRVSGSGFGSTQTEILVGPGAQTGNPASFLLRGPQFDWSSMTNNYTTMELDPARSLIRVQWVDDDASVIQSSEINY